MSRRRKRIALDEGKEVLKQETSWVDRLKATHETAPMTVLSES